MLAQCHHSIVEPWTVVRRLRIYASMSCCRWQAMGKARVCMKLECHEKHPSKTEILKNNNK